MSTPGVKSRLSLLLIPFLTLALSSCAPQEESKPSSTADTTLVGLTGADMSLVLRSDDLAYGDKDMLGICNGVWGYSLGATRSAVFNPKGKKQVEIADRKQSLRNADSLLKSGQDTYVEFSYYRKGIAEELLSPGSHDKYYDLLVSTCDKYLQVQDILETQYVPALSIQGGCWNNYADISAELQEKVSGKWVYSDSVYSLSKTSYCTDTGYPYGADFKVVRWLSDKESRNFRIVWSSWNFSSGKEKEYSCASTATRSDTNLYLISTCN